jgi:hypothetical protein
MALELARGRRIKMASQGHIYSRQTHGNPANTVIT